MGYENNSRPVKQSPKRSPGIHWLMVASLLLFVILGLLATQHISSQINRNVAHYEKVELLTQHVADHAKVIHEKVIPLINTLNAIERAFISHLAEFELFVLDPRSWSRQAARKSGTPQPFFRKPDTRCR